jgi:hypothetical protein
MKEHPILFSGPMVRAILEGRKTMTRRVIKKPWLYGRENEYGRFQVNMRECPYGLPGDRLWVRETWEYDDSRPNSYFYRADPAPDGFIENPEAAWRWRPSIHMPREASRILLEVTAVRVERLQDISVPDALREGIECDDAEERAMIEAIGDGDDRHKEAFANLWDSINAKRGYGWDSNPWVWVVEFTPLPEAPKEGE